MLLALVMMMMAMVGCPLEWPKRVGLFYGHRRYLYAGIRRLTATTGARGTIAPFQLPSLALLFGIPFPLLCATLTAQLRDARHPPQAKLQLNSVLPDFHFIRSSFLCAPPPAVMLAIVSGNCVKCCTLVQSVGHSNVTVIRVCSFLLASRIFLQLLFAVLVYLVDASHASVGGCMYV